MKTKFINPASIFIQDHNVSSLDDVIAYTEFLRKKAGLSSEPPIDLQKIITYFGLHSPESIPLPQQQGTTIPLDGIPQILVNSGDSITRRKFTIAHELIELLFLELPGKFRFDGKKTNIFGIPEKEHICQKAAASLIMPEESFRPKSEEIGLTFQSAELLADEYDVSLMAALCRLVDMYSGQCVMVLWRLKNKPSELKNKVPEGQIEIPGFHPTDFPPKKLRVAWKYGEYKNHYLPNNKSIPEDSSVYISWRKDRFTSGKETIPFGRNNLSAIIESKPIKISDERHILSLIR